MCISGSSIERYRLSVIEKGLELRVKTGLRHSSNADVAGARDALLRASIHPARTTKALLAQFKAYRAQRDSELAK